ncbi:hypothetical protein JW935_29110, partial [candidate division KSB1 bacterium]|nr:hypothetical protein [candidate division KSB1 bacterium]
NESDTGPNESDIGPNESDIGPNGPETGPKRPERGPNLKENGHGLTRIFTDKDTKRKECKNTGIKEHKDWNFALFMFPSFLPPSIPALTLGAASYLYPQSLFSQLGYCSILILEVKEIIKKFEK